MSYRKTTGVPSKSCRPEALRSTFSGWLRFLQGESHVLSHRPSLLHQQAANSPSDSEPARAAAARRGKARSQHPWLHRLNPSRASSLCVLTLADPGYDIRGCEFSHDGSRIVGICSDAAARVWAFPSGAQLLRLNAGANTYTCGYSPDGSSIFATCGGGEFFLWDAVSGSQLLHYASGCQDGTWRISADRSRAICLATDRPAFFADAARVCRTVLTAHCLERQSTPVEFDCTREGYQQFAISPDGSRLLAWAPHGVPVLLSTADWTQIARLRGYGGYVRDCCFSDDGRLVAAAASDRRWYLWNGVSGESVFLSEPGEQWVDKCYLTLAGSRLLTQGGGSVILWDTKTRSVIDTLKYDSSPITNVGLSPDGRVVLAESGWDKGCLLDADSGELLKPLGGDHLHTSCVSPGSTRLATLSGGRLTVHDLRDSNRSSVLAVHVRGDLLAFSDDLQYLLSTGMGSARIWEANRTGESEPGYGHSLGVTSCSMTSEGALCLTSSADGSLALWDGQSGDLVSLVPHQRGRTQNAVILENQKLVLAVGGVPYAWLKVYDYPDLRERHNLDVDGEGERHVALAASPDGSRVATGGGSRYRGVLKLWDTSRWTVVGEPIERTVPVQHCTFAPSGRLLLAGFADGLTLFLDAWTGQELGRLEGDYVAWAFAPRGELFVTAESGGNIVVWDAASGRPATSFNCGARATGCRVSAGNTHLLIDTEVYTTTLWDIRRGRLVRSIRHRAGVGPEAVFHPSGDLLAAAMDMEFLGLLETKTARELAGYPIGAGMSAQCWSADGKRLLVGSVTGELLMLEIVIPPAAIPRSISAPRSPASTAR
jgi:WD40 repeat protein